MFIEKASNMVGPNEAFLQRHFSWLQYRALVEFAAPKNPKTENKSINNADNVIFCILFSLH